MRDTVVHLHLSDLAALAALRGEDLTEAGLALLRNTAPAADLDAAWRVGRAAVLAETVAWSGGKIPWFGPPMSPASFLTARLMETWAHGVDVRDAAGLGSVWVPRLRHVADLGVRTRGWSFVVHGLAAPTDPVRVELASPDGPLVWGEGEQSVTGSALDFCLLVTQRRPRARLDLQAVGAAADAWLDRAQVFAGAASENRR